MKQLVATAALVVVYGAARAQEPFLWTGISLGFGPTSHSVSGLSCASGCPQYTGGIGSAPFGGALVEWNAWEKFGAAARAHYVASTLNMVATTNNVPVKDQNGNAVPLVRDYTLAVSMPEMMLDLTAFYRMDRVQFFGGMAAGLISKPTWQSSAQIVSPGNVTYGNSKIDTVFFPTQALDGARTAQMYITAGAEYNLPLTSRLALSPEIHVYFPLTSLRDGGSWKETIIETGASLKLAFFPSEALPPAPPPPPVLRREIIDTVTRATHEFAGRRVAEGREIVGTDVVRRTDTLFIGTLPPSAMLVTRAVNDDGTRTPVTVMREEVQFVTEAFPLLPFVFFDAHASTIPPRYLTAPSEGFHSNDVTANPLDIHRSVLNVVGERLRANPTSIITIRGYADGATEGGDCALARARAAAVRDYLANTWRIDTNRVTVKISNDNCTPPIATMTKSEEGYAENRRIVIDANDPAILEPLARRDFSEPVRVTPPALEHDPAGSSMENIAQWNLVVEQHGRTVLADSGAGAPRSMTHRIDPSKIDAADGAPAISTLTITDNSGLTSRVRDTIRVAVDTLNLEVERLSLTLFGTAQDQVTREDIATIRRFFEGFDPHDSVEIVGYTDKLGDTLFNENLAARRARSVDSLIHVIAPRAARVGSRGVAYRKRSPGLQSYDSPEERFLSRTVQIEIWKKR